MRMICQNVHQVVLFILFHWAMFIWGHLAAQISDARVLYNVSFCFLTDCGHLSFLLHLLCASYGHELYMCFVLCMPSLHRCLPCIFVINVVTSTSKQTRLHDVADYSPCSAVILMPCKHDATERSMHILRYFSKGVLNMWFLSIHSCPCLQLWSSLACHFRALLLLQNVSWQIV